MFDAEENTCNYLTNLFKRNQYNGFIVLRFLNMVIMRTLVF